ncbi:hypothetical protein CSKR_201261 [Clonorchis sinensis]|uniref:Uncharacterized protein n=1 Tax=Clonorchis sinensis TaxID=79923 RepID=A0A8T1MMR9_CLOSI|nr:hypothetical protein CSKR_201261 [Clonorchis sinensis]
MLVRDVALIPSLFSLYITPSASCIHMYIVFFNQYLNCLFLNTLVHSSPHSHTLCGSLSYCLFCASLSQVPRNLYGYIVCALSLFSVNVFSTNQSFLKKSIMMYFCRPIGGLDIFHMICT